MSERPYKAKSLRSAEREVRSLRKRLQETNALLERCQCDRRLFAMLAADGPCFDNPLIVAAAKAQRDLVLARECRLNPDGTPLESKGG